MVRGDWGGVLIGGTLAYLKAADRATQHSSPPFGPPSAARGGSDAPAACTPGAAPAGRLSSMSATKPVSICRAVKPVPAVIAPYWVTSAKSATIRSVAPVVVRLPEDTAVPATVPLAP